VTVLDVLCTGDTTAGWFYSETNGSWDPYDNSVPTPLFHLMDNTVEEDYYGFCINYEVGIDKGDNFMASVYTAKPTCKNNSIAYILNNWIIDKDHCTNVSAGQSAVWYFWYINDTFCGLFEPQYNHTATPTDPEWESNWIPDCSAHQKACAFINASINESVPYNISITPSTGSYLEETPIPLEAKVDYCLEELGDEVTVVFETDAGLFENDDSDFENDTIGGIARATLTCGLGVESANVTARVKDTKWFEIVDPCAEYQETIRIINLTNDANFTFVEQQLTPDIRIEKLVNGANTYTAARNETVTFNLTITNTGTANLVNLKVTDTLPADITWANAASPAEDSVAGKTIIWKDNLTAVLGPWESFTITFNATVDPEACGRLTDVATVTAESDWGDVSDSDDASVYVECEKVPVLTPFGIAALIGLLSMVTALSIKRRKG